MGIGNSNTGQKFPSTIINMKQFNIINETNASWDLYMNSIVNVKFRVYEEFENKVKVTRRNSIKVLTDMSDSIYYSPIRSSTTVTQEKISEMNLDNNSENQNRIIEDFSIKLKEIENEEKKDTNKILEKRESSVSSLIKFYQEKAKVTNDDRKSSINKTTNDSRSSIGSIISNFTKKEEEDPIQSTSHISLDSTATSNISSISQNYSNKDTFIPFHKKTKCLPPTNNKEKYRKEMSIMYSDVIEMENDTRSLKSVQSTLIKSDTKINLNNSSSNVTSSNVTLNDNENSFTILKSKDFTIPEKEEDIPDSFCEAFFIAGVSDSNTKLIDESEDFISPCQHKNCSMLPAYKPEIITRYPLKDSNRIELNSLLASLCFPLGIKLCYALKDSDLKSVKNYSTSIINQDGSRYFLMTYQFFIKVENCSFHSNLRVNIMKEFLQLEKILPLIENNAQLRKKIELKLEKQLEICTEFNFNEYVYVPYSVCLISKYPYLKQMEICIQKIVRMIVDENTKEEEIHKLILHITREIPIPSNNKKVLFYLPDMKIHLELTAPIYKNLPIFNNNLINLLNIFSIENIITIHHLMILEQKILFVGEEYNQLSEVIESFNNLLYPMQWTHTYIPILSEEMIKYLQSFMPFIMGIDQSLMNYAKTYLEEEDNIYIIYIKKDMVDISSNKKGKKLKKKEIIKIPEYPNELEKYITKKITELKKVIEKNKNKINEINQNAVELCIRDIFIKVFVRMIGDFNKYNALIDDIPLFNTESFLQNRPEKDSQFYSEFTDTQLFRNFLQMNNTKENFPYFHSQIEKYSSIVISREKKEPIRRSNSITGRRTSISKSLVENEESNYKDIILNSSINEFIKENMNQNLNLNSTENNLRINNLSMKFSKEVLNLLEIISTFEQAETYAISPYFLSNNNFVDLSEINKILKGEDSKILNEKERIFTYINKLNLKEISNKVRRFDLPETKINSRLISNIVNVSTNKNNISKSILSRVTIYENKAEQAKKNKLFMKSGKKGDNLTPSEQEEVKNIINESLRMILTSEKLSLENKKTLDSFFKTTFGREHFSKSVFQSKFLENKEHCLSKESFDDLFALIFQALLVEMEENLVTFNLVRFLTKSIFYYFKSNGKSNYYLYQEMKNKKGTFSIWKNEKFWYNWFDLEKKESKSNTNVDLSKFSEDEMTFHILLDISRIMNQINIECKFILNSIVDNLGKKNIKDEKLLNELNLVILKQSKNIEELY